jgi:hypothetical protein
MMCFDEFKTYSEQRGPHEGKSQAVLNCYMKGKAAIRESCAEELVNLRDCLLVNPRKSAKCKQLREALEECGAKNIMKK